MAKKGYRKVKKGMLVLFNKDGTRKEIPIHRYVKIKSKKTAKKAE